LKTFHLECKADIPRWDRRDILLRGVTSSREDDLR
jgi:hypothetical protein